MTRKAITRPLPALAILAACGSTERPSETSSPGVVFTYPSDGMRDVPLGTRVVVTFSGEVSPESAAAVKLVAEGGAALDVIPEITASRNGVVFDAPPLAAGTTYAVTVNPAIFPQAENLPPPGTPLFQFRTRSDAPRADAPSLLSVGGGAPESPEIVETTTLRLVFSEPLDRKTVVSQPGSVQLVDDAGRPVAATVLADGIHVSIDPVDDLTAGATYRLELGERITDLDGHGLAPRVISLVPRATRSGAPIVQILRTRQDSDPGPALSLAGAPANVATIRHPLIGALTTALQPGALRSELGDPAALGGPIAITIRKGSRLRLSPLDVELGGALPSGLSIGEVTIELLTDGNGLIHRNPYRDPNARPDNRDAPLYVDLDIDIALFADDPGGNAVLTETILGVQATGTAIAGDGALAIETVAAMELPLLGIARAPSNFVLSLVTDPGATAAVDSTAPVLLASSPADGDDAAPGGGDPINLVFDEPVDLRRAIDGGVVLERAEDGEVVPAIIESHGAALAVRPIGGLDDGADYRLALDGVTDNAGNPAGATVLSFSTRPYVATGAPLTASSVYPGAPCALSDSRCLGGRGDDEPYRRFAIPANAPIEASFTQPLLAGSVELGAGCDHGSVRVERVDDSGACVDAVPGTLVARDRSISFYPEAPWSPERSYRLTLVSGPNASCDYGELCGKGGVAASFDPLNGTAGAAPGGADLVIDFVGSAPTTSTLMVTGTEPFTDVNGSGFVDEGEKAGADNRAALVIAGRDGAITGASWTRPDCVPETPELENCMYMQGTMPVAIGAPATGCALADGSRADTCIPVTVSVGAMYSTSLTMAAQVVGLLTINSATGTSVMRIREPAGGGPIVGHIVDRGGTPNLIVGLDLYMDAPDMSLPIGNHDLHSKPISVVLAGPLTFLPDGRIAIALANTADVAIDVAIDAAIAAGTVHMRLPAGQLNLQLVSPPRGGDR